MDWLIKILNAFTKPNPQTVAEYRLTPEQVAVMLSPLNLTQLKLWDSAYFCYTLSDWVKALSETRNDMPSFIAEKFDCDKFATVTAARIILERKINTCGICEGDTPFGYHAWNIIIAPDGPYYYEPQNGNLWPVPGTAGYVPRFIIFP